MGPCSYSPKLPVLWAFYPSPCKTLKIFISNLAKRVSLSSQGVRAKVRVEGYGGKACEHFTRHRTFSSREGGWERKNNCPYKVVFYPKKT